MASIINFLPNQDLNGYDHPWPAGGNKNLYNSATDTPNAWIRANEPVGEIISTTYNYRLTDYIAVLPNTTYTINYNLSSTATSAGMVFFSEKEETAIVGAISLSKQTHSVNEGEPVNSYTFTTAENCNYLRFSTFPGSNNIQLELGDTATDYAPHSNICPITAPVHIVGKNLFNPWINGYYSPTSGKMAGTGMTTDITSRPIYAKAGTVFTLSQVTSSYAYSFEEWSICPQSSSDMVAANLLARSSNVTGGRRTYTVQNDCYVTFRSYRPPGTAVETAKIQAELGDTATEYEPYTETPIYGGYLDIGNNEIVEGWIKIILNENVNLATGGDSYEGTKGTNRIILLDLRSAYAVAGTSKHILDKIKTVYTYTWGQPNEHIWESCINAYKQLHIVFDNQTVGITTEMTKAERTAKIRAWLTNNPLEVAYQLETPIHHTLNSAQLAYIMTELNVRYSSMLESRRRIIMNSPHIDTATGSTAFFKTDLKASIKDCKIYFTPEQEGTGDPSPTNIRPINCVTRVNVGQTGKAIAEVVGYSTVNGSSLIDTRKISNTYGTTLSTTDFIAPHGEVTITQTQWDSTPLYSYHNGYFTIYVDNLVFGKYYTVSLRITNIINNPLNIDISSINSFALQTPSGGAGNHVIKTVDGDRIIWQHVQWQPYSMLYTRSNFEIRNCGLSFTMSDFMVTAEDDEDQTYESYEETEITSITLPFVTKNHGNIVGYSVSTCAHPKDPKTISGRYGTTLSTIYPENILTITQNQWDETRNKTDYRNGYFDIIPDNLEFGKKYILSFKVDEVINDPLNATVEAMALQNPSGGGNVRGTMVGDRLVFSPLTFSQYSARPYSTDLSIRNCGISMTISDIMITEEDEEDQTYVPFKSNFYGGYIDLINGEIVAEWGVIDCLWKNYVNTNEKNGMTRHEFDFVNPVQGYGVTGESRDMFCNITLRSYTDTYTIPHFYVLGQNNRAYVYLPAETDDNTRIVILAKLKEPIHYPIDPITLKSLKGTNNIWADTNGNIELKYWTH